MISTIVLVVMAAAEPSFRAPPNCWEGAQNELTYCAATEFRQADAELLTLTREAELLFRRVDEDAKVLNFSHVSAFRSGQSAWVAFRDAHCSIFEDGDGSIAPMRAFKCKRDLTLQRIEQVQKLMLNPATGSPYYEDDK